MSPIVATVVWLFSYDYKFIYAFKIDFGSKSATLLLLDLSKKPPDDVIVVKVKDPWPYVVGGLNTEVILIINYEFKEEFPTILNILREVEVWSEQ